MTGSGRGTASARAAVLALVALMVPAGCSDAPPPALPDPAGPTSVGPSPVPSDPTPTPTPTPPSSGAPTASASSQPLVILFYETETIDARDAVAVAAGGIPATLRVLDGPDAPLVSTTLTCRRRTQRMVEVPIRRDGLLELRRTARVVARLADSRDVVVLAARSDLAIVLLRDEQGRVRGRASALQIDERWFVGDIEACR